ncbi:hydantoinase/oxoprolinase family protein [Lysinibacter sp. HNR]|uniref:hydantoinase/oxoprolinase family protein n=1 Tax=Lysinibacter sp. HNR TaxID=3031408 RepID=UPI0024356E19|nr:hydantoinase/oxoprolinase family protein [Lysinibacter sp. HNR]WGD37895.1 hydantoinase/oxoprolinase family protein [Lysinibacter sp. HNR]
MSYRIGIDVGGTNTDAALLDDQLRVITTVKVPTKTNSGEGITHVIERLMRRSGISGAEVSTAMLGTTHCTNAIVQRKGLRRVGILRIGGPATTAVPPFEGWPADLRATVEGYAAVITGGHEFNGREISRLDRDAVLRACTEMRGLVDAVAVVGVFSSVNIEHETIVGKIVREELDVPVSLSSQIGTIGLLERENATILNAALIQTLGDMADGFQRALDSYGIAAKIYFGQNDGTLMSLDYALQFPVLTIGCGPTNSIRGAAHLSGVENALIVDIGGTTTDIGVLTNGFPRQSAHAVEIGGIRTNFRMPDVLSIGLGGGTIIRTNPADSQENLTLGPDSVGYRISQESLVFGGNTLTTTDIAVAAGRLNIAGRRSPQILPELFQGAERAIRSTLEEAIDRMKPSANPVPIVLVGGGSIISPLSLEGTSSIMRPEHAEAANAVGAALGDIAAQVENVFSLKEISRAEAVSRARIEVIERTITAGASPSGVEVISIEEFPVAYMEDAFIVRVRAAGQLA